MHKNFIVIIFIIGLFSAIQKSLAEKDAEKSVNDAEKAVFAYLQLTNQKPDYEALIKNSQKYLESGKARQAKMLEEEKARLDWGFATFNVKEDLITIKAKIRLTTAVREDGIRMVYTRFVEERHNETPYFPILFGEDSIAFVIQNLEQYRAIQIKPEEVPKIKQYFYDSAPYEAEIEMRIRPVSADASDKLFVDYKEQWLMLGEIAYLKINYYDEFKLETVNVWDYNAPWYLDESQRALLNLFKEPETE